MNHVLHVEVADVAALGSEVRLMVTGPDRVEVNGWEGKSSGQRIGEGRFALEVRERPPLGTRAESHVVEELKRAFRQLDGVDIEYTGGADHKGEDGFVQVRDRKYVLQIVNVPIDEDWGRLVAKGFAKMEFSTEEGAEMIRVAIQKKACRTARADRANMVLALDAQHAGILGHQDIVATLRCGEPDLTCHGFAQIWLAAPGSFCQRLSSAI